VHDQVWPKLQFSVGLLGHASLDTTRIYTHASMVDLESALEDNLLTDD
jgi:site-specific recombinase XerD